ncbi:Uncharacterised protein [Vibrio cholerae]|nr:Uncharacterised protein [Vibrio cholerae]
MLRNFWRNVTLTAVNDTDRIDHFIRCRALREITCGTRLHHFGWERIFGMYRQYDNFNVRINTQQLLGCFQATNTRHVHIH